MSYSGGYSRGRDDGGSSSSCIKVESANVGKIIGRGGCKIRELEQVCGARIKISREADEKGMKTIEICGSEEEIEKATRMIEEYLSESSFSGGGGGGGRRGGFGGSRGRTGGSYGRRDDGDNWNRRDREGGDGWGRRGGDDYDRGSRGGGGGGGRGYSDGGDSETIFVESGEVGKIIGRGGIRIRDMESESGCRIKVSKDQDHNGCSSVELCGSKSSITEAKRLIKDCGVEIVNGNDRGRGW